MNRNDLTKRTAEFAQRVRRLAGALPSHGLARAIARQLAATGSAIASHAPAPCDARSADPHLARLQTVGRKAAECAHWMEVLIVGDLITESRVLPLLREADDLAALAAPERHAAPHRPPAPCLAGPQGAGRAVLAASGA